MDVALVPPDDVEALAAAIVRLAADPIERAQLSAGGQAVAARFDWSTIADAHLELYASLLQHTGTVRGGRR